MVETIFNVVTPNCKQTTTRFRRCHGPIRYKVILVGNLGQDPELRYTGSGTAVCNMRLATNESYKDAGGELVEKTEWHSVVTWARLAEICGEYLRKGSQVYFEGSLQTRQWEDRDGNTRHTTEVKAREMMMLDSRGESTGVGSAENGRRQTRPDRDEYGRSSGRSQDRDMDPFGTEGGLPF